MAMERVGGLAIHMILSKLGPKETAKVGCVSHHFREWASDEFLWYQFCAQELQLSSPENPLGNPTPSFKAAYQAWRESFGMYPWSLVLRVKRCWERIRSWLVVNFPEAVTTMRKGATEDEINNLEESLKVKLPLPTRVLYRFCDGQDLVEFSEIFSGSLLGLIGGYSFYSHLVNVYLLPLDKMISVTNDVRRHLLEHVRLLFGPQYIVVAASSTESKKFFLLDCSSGNLYVGSRMFLEFGDVIPCVPDELIHPIRGVRDCQQQDGMLLWLEEHGRRLENGVIKVSEEKNTRYISLFPEESSLCSTAVTNGVQVRASGLFVPELSEIAEADYYKYLFTYSIRMCLKPEGCIVNGMRFGSCQLYRRHWVIRENDNIVSDVNEEAVVGKVSSTLHPGGKEFIYQSCTTLHSYQGSFIKGSFTFVPGRLTDPKGAEFEVEGPQFFIQEPDFIF